MRHVGDKLEVGKLAVGKLAEDRHTVGELDHSAGEMPADSDDEGPRWTQEGQHSCSWRYTGST